jgi:hypothetical protein
LKPFSKAVETCPSPKVGSSHHGHKKPKNRVLREKESKKQVKDKFPQLNPLVLFRAAVPTHI